VGKEQKAVVFLQTAANFGQMRSWILGAQMFDGARKFFQVGDFCPNLGFLNKYFDTKKIPTR